MKRYFLLAIIFFGCDGNPKPSDRSDAPASIGDSSVSIADRRTCAADEKRAAWILECVKAASALKTECQNSKDVMEHCQASAEDTMCPLATWCHAESKWIAPCTNTILTEKCAEVCKGKKPEEKKPEEKKE